MTKEEIFKQIIDGELFKTIDQSEDINSFIHERENMIGVKVTEDPEYKRLREKRRQMEAEFESLYLEPAIGKEKTMAYNDLITEITTITEFAHYRAGICEGIKLIFGLLVE